jgi:peptide/nickel transport system substrate-binding protein
VLIVALASAPVFGQYQQSPYLDGMDLPPVEERIPVDPLVIAPGTYGMTEIGLFGGIYASQAPDAANAQGMTNVAIPFWGEAKMERPEVLPLAFKSIESANGNRVFTITMRTGLRWSDGEPYTTEDYLFWFEDVASNPELSAAIPGWLTQGDAVVEMTAVDDVTLRFEFPNPYPGFDIAFGARQERQAMGNAKHYLTQFHKSYADADTLAAKVDAGGFEDWTQLFNAKADRRVNANPDNPTMVPFVPSTGIEATPVVWTRNAYYWSVDSEGNQLPYMDEQHTQIIPDGSARDLRVLAGEISVASVGLPKVEIHKQAADRGDLQMISFPFRGDLAERTLSFNWFALDEFKAEMFSDKRFRLAISYWAPRQLLSDLLYEGLAPVRQIGVSDPASPWYVEELATLAVERDLDMANALLDEMGLTNKDADGFRLGPDGKPITLTILSIATWFDDTWTLLVEELPKIGFKGNFRGVGWGGQGEVVDNMDWEILGWQSLTGYANRDWPSNFGGGWNSLFPSPSWSLPWYQWITSGGERGEQPPDWAQEMWDLAQAAKSAESDEELTEKIIALQKLQAEYLIGIDLLQFARRFRVYGADIGNVQEWFIQMPTIFFHRDAEERAKTLGG